MFWIVLGFATRGMYLLGELQWAAFNAENLNRRYHLATTKIFENQVQGAPS